MSGVTWRPLIADPARRTAIAEVIVGIVTAIEAWRRSHPEADQHAADYALLRAYTAADEIVPDPDGEAEMALAEVVAGIEAGDSQGPSLNGGIARIVFTIDQLCSGDQADAATEMLERSLLQFLGSSTERPSTSVALKACGLVDGLAGLALPALQRIAEGRPSVWSEPLARRILDHLEDNACAVPTGLMWYASELGPEESAASSRSEATSGRRVNLGMAHGVPGVVAILSRYIAAGVDGSRARPLLDHAMRYLQSVAEPRVGARYHASLPARHMDAVSRVAWCYGDLGVSMAMMSAAIATGREDWRADALELAHGVAARSFETSQVLDAGLCHGAGGVAHLFNRLSQAAADDELAHAAETWFARTLEMRRSDAVAGYPRARPVAGALVWEPAIDVPTGAAGVALALHAAISRIEPSWDRLLLADLAPATARDT